MEPTGQTSPEVVRQVLHHVAGRALELVELDGRQLGEAGLEAAAAASAEVAGALAGVVKLAGTDGK